MKSSDYVLYLNNEKKYDVHEECFMRYPNAEM